MDNTPKNANFTYVFVEDAQYPGIGSAQETGYYIAPPDLLRYCTSNANISGLFSHCGVSGWNGQWNGIGGNKYKYGITGRICPYMLKPVPDTTDISDLFHSCKKLNYYKVENEPAYLIPKDFFTYATKITTLDRAFADLLFPKDIDIDVFEPLTGTLSLGELFYQSYWAGTETEPVNIENIFNEHRVSKTSRAFCIVDNVNESTDRTRNQYIKFNNVFNSMYASATYAGNTNFEGTFRGYSVLTVEHENPKTLTDAEANKNYETSSK